MTLVCQSCGAQFYTAASETMLTQGSGCDRCGGELVADDDPLEGG